MRATNTVVLIGRITKDIEIRVSQNDSSRAVAKFNLAVDRAKKNSQGQYETDFISCVAFDKTAEFLGKYFSKGMKVGVCGEIRTGSYTNRDGQKVYTTDVYVDKADFVESRQTAQNGREGGSNSQANNYAPRHTEPRRNDSDAFKNQSRGNGVGDGFMSMDDFPEDSDGLPFA